MNGISLSFSARSWAPPFGARWSHGAVRRPWAAPNVAPRPRRRAEPWRRHHRQPGLGAPPADRPLHNSSKSSKLSKTLLSTSIYISYHYLTIYFCNDLPFRVFKSIQIIRRFMKRKRNAIVCILQHTLLFFQEFTSRWPQSCF